MRRQRQMCIRAIFKSGVVTNDLRNKKRVIQSYSYEIGDIKNQGFKFLKDLGIKVNSFYYNEKDYTYTLLTENFETMIK